MYKIIDQVKAGIEKPSAISNAVIGKRASNLDVSDCKRISHDDTFTVSIQHLQGDNCEGRFLLSGRSNGSLLLHNIKNMTKSMKYECKRLWKRTKSDKDGHRFSVECVRWFPTDNGIFVSGGFDKTLKIWDTSCLECVETFLFEGKIYNFDLSPARTRNCTVAVCSSMGVVSILELHSGTNVHTLKHHQGDVFTCNWSPFEEHILATGGYDNKVFLWDIRSAKSCLMSLNRCNTKENNARNPCKNSFTAHAGPVTAVKFVRNGLKLVSCGTDNSIRLWDTLDGKNELVDYESYVNSSKKSVQIDISRSTTPEYMYIPCNDSINVYQVESGKLVKQLGGHFSNVNCCYYEPFEHELYSGCTDGLILIWCDDDLLSTTYCSSCDWPQLSDFEYRRNENSIS